MLLISAGLLGDGYEPYSSILCTFFFFLMQSFYMLSIIQLSYSSEVDNGVIWGIFSPFLP